MLQEKFTLETLKTALENKNLKYEMRQVGTYSELLGITLDKGVWHWFYIHPDILDNSLIFLTFHHSYSQNTGGSKKGTRHGLRITSAISKRIGIDL